MNIEPARKWMLHPSGNESAIGAALRHAIAGRADPLPDDVGTLLGRLDRCRRSRAA